MLSIRSKLSLWLTALVIISTIVSMILFESMLRDAFHDSLINRLEEDLEQVLMATHIEKGTISVNQAEISHFYKPAYSGRYFQLNLPNHDVIRSRSLWDQELNVELLQKDKIKSWQAKGPQNHDMQLLSVGISSANSKHVATITVAQDLSIGRRVFSEIYGTKLLINIAMLGFMILAIFLILKQSFKPINQIKTALIKLKAGDISSLEMDHIPTEIKPLAQTYNDLLDYTEKQVERSRHHIGNLSHGLKTPLAVLQQQIEVLGLRDPKMANDMQKQLNLINTMIEHKLTTARMTGHLLPAAQFMLPKDLASLSNTLQKVYAQKNIDYQLTMDNSVTRLPIHREDGLELLGNILDNAFKFGKSIVTVFITQTDNHLLIVIEDDGNGVNDNKLNRLTQRGSRLDESIMGHGLGLSIVKAITEQYNIKLTFNKSTCLGGLKISLVFS